MHRFIRENGRWYIDLPEYLEKGGSKGELEMVAGADVMLGIMARGRKSITLLMDTEKFEGADQLELLELCEAPMGGGYYVMRTYNGKHINKKMWLCDVTLFVFGDMPENIFIKEVIAEEQNSFIKM